LMHNDKMERLISFDLGIRNDPTVISFFFRDPIAEVIYLHRQVRNTVGLIHVQKKFCFVVLMARSLKRVVVSMRTVLVKRVVAFGP